MGEDRPARLVDHETLLRSDVVANNAMNRERQLSGVNSYARELGFDPVDLLSARLDHARLDHVAGRVGWLDLCCGQGRALLQADERLRRAGLSERVALVGVDLVDLFAPRRSGSTVELCCAPLETWMPSRSFDLITCVHGLHYVGDKLAVLVRAAGWLAPDGRLVADLDLAAVRPSGGTAARRRLLAHLRDAGFSYDPRRRRISCLGPVRAELPYTYLGADDRAGANYTGQPAVDSYYLEHH